MKATPPQWPPTPRNFNAIRAGVSRRSNCHTIRVEQLVEKDACIG